MNRREMMLTTAAAAIAGTLPLQSAAPQSAPAAGGPWSFWFATDRGRVRLVCTVRIAGTSKALVSFDPVMIERPCYLQGVEVRYHNELVALMSCPPVWAERGISVQPAPVMLYFDLG